MEDANTNLYTRSLEDDDDDDNGMAQFNQQQQYLN